MEAISSKSPQMPRPPSEEIDAVYGDLAKVLSASQLDTDGQRAIGRDALEQHLYASGHTLAAVEWAIHLFCEQGYLLAKTFNEKQVRTVRPGVNEVKPRIVEMPAIAASEEFWERYKAGSFSIRQKEVILLIHGIRTFAGWQPMVKRVLEEIPNTRVIPIKYGYLDAFRFWFPFFTRKAAIDELRREIGNARAANPDVKISVIAHSFGTYAISRILSEHPDIKLHRLILSGSIIPRSYRWNYVRSQLSEDVINDYGTRDIWPVLAKCLSWGYGDTGRHGFGRGAYVNDRGHDYAHSDFFNEKFVRDYWKPWFEQNSVAPSPWPEKAPPTPWFLSTLSVVPLQNVILLVAIVLTAYYFMRNTATASDPVDQSLKFRNVPVPRKVYEGAFRESHLAANPSGPPYAAGIPVFAYDERNPEYGIYLRINGPFPETQAPLADLPLSDDLKAKNQMTVEPREIYQALQEWAYPKGKVAIPTGTTKPDKRWDVLLIPLRDTAVREVEFDQLNSPKTLQQLLFECHKWAKRNKMTGAIPLSTSGKAIKLMTFSPGTGAEERTKAIETIYPLAD